jgi:nucleotide-binding universal stress UspA family protein
MVPIRKILVPIDFSDASKRVLDFGRTLADACGASLHLLHVMAYPVATVQTIDEERRDACSRLDALLDSTDRGNRHATTSCEVGTPTHEIVNYAAEHEIDLIVMGTHWHGPTFQMVTGSIAEGVLGLAPCAVLAVKGAKRSACESAFDPVPATTTTTTTTA